MTTDNPTNQGAGEIHPSPESSEASSAKVGSAPDTGGITAGRTDKFRQAKIIRFFPQAGYGFVKDSNGKEIYFHLDELRFVGEKRDASYITEGAEVGVDVGRTSRGTRVTRLKIY